MMRIYGGGTDYLLIAPDRTISTRIKGNVSKKEGSQGGPTKKEPRTNQRCGGWHPGREGQTICLAINNALQTGKASKNKPK